MSDQAQLNYIIINTPSLIGVRMCFVMVIIYCQVVVGCTIREITGTIY